MLVYFISVLKTHESEDNIFIQNALQLLDDGEGDIRDELTFFLDQLARAVLGGIPPIINTVIIYYLIFLTSMQKQKL